MPHTRGSSQRGHQVRWNGVQTRRAVHFVGKLRGELIRGRFNFWRSGHRPTNILNRNKIADRAKTNLRPGGAIACHGAEWGRRKLQVSQIWTCTAIDRNGTSSLTHGILNQFPRGRNLTGLVASHRSIGRSRKRDAIGENGTLLGEWSELAGGSRVRSLPSCRPR